jgi:hypothetical protein
MEYWDREPAIFAPRWVRDTAGDDVWETGWEFGVAYRWTVRRLPALGVLELEVVVRSDRE